MDDHQFPSDLIDREVAAICAAYRITPDDARAVFEETVRRRPDFVHKILPKLPEQDVTRLKAYRLLMKEVRKQVYYRLRQYLPEKDSIEQLRQRLADALARPAAPDAIAAAGRHLLQAHVSTRERLEQYPEFYDTLFRLIDPPGSILDVGCGLHPLSYPYPGGIDLGWAAAAGAGMALERYVAIDKQPDVIETLRVLAPTVAPTRLAAICADIAEDGVLPDDECDLAFLLKLIPVLARQQRDVLPKLAALPARRMLVTATAEAMTRKRNIRKREERVLRDFVQLTGRRVLARVQVGHEFGVLLGEPGDGSA